MRKSGFLMLKALKSAPHPNDSFGILFFIFRKYDMPIPTFKRRIFMNSWQLYITKLAATTVSTYRRILYRSMIPT